MPASLPLFAAPAALLLGAGCAPGPGDVQGADVTWGERIEVAAGPAELGPWRMNESEWDYVDDPTVATDAEGAAIVAWVGQGRKDVFLQVHEDVFLQVHEPDGSPRRGGDAPPGLEREPGGSGGGEPGPVR